MNGTLFFIGWTLFDRYFLGNGSGGIVFDSDPPFRSREIIKIGVKYFLNEHLPAFSIVSLDPPYRDNSKFNKINCGIKEILWECFMRNDITPVWYTILKISSSKFELFSISWILNKVNGKNFNMYYGITT